MAKQKKVNKGNYIKNAHLIGKGGGEVKPVNGSYVKGVKKARPSPNKPSPKIKEHIKTEPAKIDPGGTPGRRRQLGSAKKVAAPKSPAKKTTAPAKKVITPKTPVKRAPTKAPAVAKKAPTLPKPAAKVVTNKKAPAKSAIAKAQVKAKHQAAPKKKAMPKKTVAKKAPVRRR